MNNGIMNNNFWKNYFTVYDILLNIMPYKQLITKLCSSLKISSNDLILDAGCGTGNLCKLIENNRGRVIGLDIEFSGLLRAKKKISKCRFVIGNLNTNLPFSDNTFDKIVSNNVLYCVNKNDRKKVIHEFYRVLKPNGTIVISNPIIDFNPFTILDNHIKLEYKKFGLFYTILNNIKLLTSIIKLFFYYSIIKKNVKKGSYSFFQKMEQKELLSSCGFKNISNDIFVYANQSIMNIGAK